MKIEEKLKNYSQMSSIEIFKDLKTSIDGISFTEIEEKQEEYGKNVIDIKNNNTTLSRLKEVFINPFNIVLIIVAIITFFYRCSICNKQGLYNIFTNYRHCFYFCYDFFLPAN